MQIVFQGQTAKGLEILIRYPLKEDVFLLQNYINTLSKEQTFIRFQGEQVTLKEEQKYLDSMIKKVKKNQAVKLLVFNKSILIGLSDITMKDKIANHVGVFGITIAKGFRNQGLGKLLMELVIREAKKNIPELKIITLGMFSNNPIARKMYKKFGFQEYGVLAKGVKHRGDFIDHVYMCKNI